MKKILFSSIFLFLLTILNAQLITITETNQMPQINDTIKYIDANTFGFDADGVGPVTAKIWDFATLLLPGTTIDYMYSDATLTPQTALFPNANIARENTVSAGYDYYETTGTQVIRWGVYGDTSNWISNRAPAIEFQFPITAGGSYNCAYTADFAPFNVGEDSMVVDNGQIIVNADMQGTLILPNGTLVDVLRLHLIESFHIKAYMFGIAVTDNLVEDDYYYWFHDTILQPVLIYGTTSLDGTQQAEVLRYQEIDFVTSITNEDLDNMVCLYPNPTNGSIAVEGQNISNIDVYNLIGEKISSYEVNSFNTVIDLSDNQGGVYIFKIYSANSTIVKRIILEK